MKWLHVNEYGFDYRYLLSEPGETNRMIVAAVATASFNSAWPEGGMAGSSGTRLPVRNVVGASKATA